MERQRSGAWGKGIAVISAIAIGASLSIGPSTAMENKVGVGKQKGTGKQSGKLEFFLHPRVQSVTPGSRARIRAFICARNPLRLPVDERGRPDSTCKKANTIFQLQPGALGKLKPNTGKSTVLRLPRRRQGSSTIAGFYFPKKRGASTLSMAADAVVNVNPVVRHPNVPATVGVVDQDEGLWYLVDPVLAGLTGDGGTTPGNTSATGQALVTFDQRDDRACYDLTTNGLTSDIIAGHIHMGPPGTDGPVVLDLELPLNGERGCVDGSAELIDQILADLEGFYVNVHTVAFPDGAIRGQLGGGPLPPFFFGDPDEDPFLGDWDGDGIDTPGLYRPSDGRVRLRESTAPDSDNIEFFFGDQDDVPIVGDWDGDGDDTVSLYRPSEGKVFITNRIGTDGERLDKAEIEFLFGDPGDDPFGGDFDDDGFDTIGVKRGDKLWWRNSLDSGPFDNSGFLFGDLDDEAMFGDWDGDGLEDPGVYRPSTRTIHLGDIRSSGIEDMEIFTDGFESGDTSAWSYGG